MKYYLLGVIANLAFLLILGATADISFEHSSMYHSDAREYYNYAKAFTQEGTFYDPTNYNPPDGKPGYQRTIGYPLLLSGFIVLFGAHWLMALQFFNCFFFALLYIIIPGIIYDMFGKRRDKEVFWFLLLTGIVLGRLAQPLNNEFFAVLLFLGIWVGVKAIKTNKWWLMASYVIIISYTSTVRLTIEFFCLFNILLFVYFKGRFWPMVITSLIFLFTCNFNSFRNLYNHGAFISSNIPERSIKEYLIKDIQEKGVMPTLWHNTKNVALDNHLINNMGNYYGYNWKAFKEFKKSKWLAVPYVLYALFYIFFGFLTITIACDLIFQHEWLLLLMIAYFLIFFITPAMIIGTGGSRLRLEYELFILIIMLGTNFHTRESFIYTHNYDNYSTN